MNTEINIKEKETDYTLQLLQNGLENVLASEKYNEWLDNMNKFHMYSIRNYILIYLQMPDASQVAGYNKWKAEFNRQVNNGEKGIAIIAPVPVKYKTEKEKIDPETNLPIKDADGNIVKEILTAEDIAYKVVYVFDISQTHQIEGKPKVILSPVENLIGEVKNYEKLEKAIIASSPVPVHFKKYNGSSNGYYNSLKDEIVIKEGMSQVQTIKTTIHEVAHAILHCGIKDVNKNFYVAESGEFHNLGLYKEGLSLNEAIDLYNQIPDTSLNGIKEIGIIISDESSIYYDMPCALVRGDVIVNHRVDMIDGFKKSLEVQKAIYDLQSHFPNDDMKLANIRELQAESIAYVTAHNYGIDTSEYSFGYVASWSEENPNKIVDELDTIKACSMDLINRIDDNLKLLNALDISRDSLTNNIDNFIHSYDPNTYEDTEVYPSSHKDEIYSDLLRGKTKGIKDFLRSIIDDNINPSDVFKAKDLMTKINEYEATFNKVETIELKITRSKRL